VDCRGLISIRPEFVGKTSVVKMEGKEWKSERFLSLRTFIDATINYYCMRGDLLVDYVSQKAAPTYHFVVVMLLLCVFRSENFKARDIFHCMFSLFGQIRNQSVAKVAGARIYGDEEIYFSLNCMCKG